ncbi:SLATT domain-containing protein [Bordetella bronchialis]|uniref:SLATT domain-containing protein n=1 Tax=Bordetella bronchialis TaxID=463025 RepID=UPI003D085A39
MHGILHFVRKAATDDSKAHRRSKASNIDDLTAFLTGRVSIAPLSMSSKIPKSNEMKDIRDANLIGAEILPTFPEINKPKTEAEQLLLRVRVTQKCRYNASVRLRRYYRFRLFTSMAFAVGLILIPLLQNSPIPLGFSGSVIAMVQVLLAVGILVFTVIAGKAGYELRSERLTQEGDSLKELSRRLGRQIASGANLRLDDYHHEYFSLAAGKEGHARSDYLQARLEMRDDFPLWAGKRLLLRIGSTIYTFSSYVIPLALILMEVAFVADMLNLTAFFPHVLHLAAAPVVR